jgi:hypothetical protein
MLIDVCILFLRGVVFFVCIVVSVMLCVFMMFSSFSFTFFDIGYVFDLFTKQLICDIYVRVDGESRWTVHVSVFSVYCLFEAYFPAVHRKTEKVNGFV